VSVTDADASAAPATATGRGWRWWVYTALMAAAGGWLVFVLTHLLLSGRWWLWLIVDILPPGMFVVVPVALAAGASPCRRSRRPVLLLSGVALVIGLPLSGLNVGSLLPNPPAPPDAVSVFAWNTEYWDQSGPGLYEFLAGQRADVYLLQEYLYDENPPGRVDALPRLRSTFPGYDIAVAGELVTISRFPIVARYPLDARVRLSDRADEWLADYTRHKVLRTDLDLGGRMLSVYNVHLPVQLSPDVSPFGAAFYRTAREQWNQREPQWTVLADDVAANPQPVLVAGDLNTTPAMGDLRKLPSRVHDASGAMRELYPVSFSESHGRPPWWRLDWAFVSDEVAVHRYEFGASHGQSDHRYQHLLISLP
jgi:endonuclease/exonuclease/phosphatase (EEP) superfamily protein YafD